MGLRYETEGCHLGDLIAALEKLRTLPGMHIPIDVGCPFAKCIAHRCYFGHPSAGFFLPSDFFTAASQSPSILRISGFGPGFALAAFLAFFLDI